MFRKTQIILLAGALILTFSSCKKIMDEIIKGSGGAGYLQCSILSYTGSDVLFGGRSGGNVYTRSFAYNACGNPSTGKVTPKDYYDNPDFSFHYDSGNRLKELALNEDFQQADMNNDGIPDTLRIAFVLHRYTHDVKGNIVTDSVFFNYQSGKTGERYSGSKTDSFEYDRFRRIVKSTERYGSGVPVITAYVYNEEGNLSKDNTAYDHKKNYHLTSRVWQFIDRDYSVNNPFTASQYNNTGLPLKSGNSTFVYSCK
jgi:hypothetical protein